MLCIFRLFFVVIYCTLVSILGSIYCLFSPRNPKHVSFFSHIFGRLAPLFGLKVETRFPKGVENLGNAIYISNHQNSYDMITVSNIILPQTVTVGKKTLLWIPFFGQLYWLTGNLLIERNNYIKAYNTISKVIDQFKKRRISIWIFPEGTRSRGRGLLRFKTGAFRAAIEAGVPVIPVCVSNISNKIRLNRLHNGLVIIEMLPPLDISGYKKNQVRELADDCCKLMMEKIDALNKEVEKREITGNI